MFNEEYYLQLNGTAMGTKMAPSYANLFMRRFETQILERATNKPTVWWRYIDDVFTIWPHCEGASNNF